MIPGDKFVTEIQKLDPNLKPLLTLKAIEEEIVPYEVNMVSPTLNVRVMHNDNIAWGYPLKYEIFIVSPEGVTIRKIVKDYDPVKITKKMREEIIKETIGDREIPDRLKLKFPKNYYPYYFFICGDATKVMKDVAAIGTHGFAIDEQMNMNFIRDIAREHGVGFGGNLKLTLALSLGLLSPREDAIVSLAAGGHIGYTFAPG